MLNKVVNTGVHDFYQWPRPDTKEQYRNGQTKLLGFFVGQVMQATQGKANPKQVNELLRKLLDE